MSTFYFALVNIRVFVILSTKNPNFYHNNFSLMTSPTVQFLRLKADFKPNLRFPKTAKGKGSCCATVIFLREIK